ncbi:hypothetical protein LTS17_003924 [Exophiala oligosperma]
MASHNMKSDSDSIQHLDRQQTIQSVNLSMEMFEKLYLAPRNRVRGELRKTFANPTPLPLLGFLITAAPLSCALMGWRGAGGGGAATIGTFYFFGGLLQIMGCVMEWLIGNTFPFVVFGSFGAFFLTFGATLTPMYNAEAAFTASATTEQERAIGVASFEASLAVLLLTGAYWKAAQGDVVTFQKLEVASGAFVFAICILGFYLLFAQLLESVEFPLQLPVGDLSKRFARRKLNESDEAV